MRAVLSIVSPSLARGMSITLNNGQELSIGSSRWADLALNDRALSGVQFQLSMLPTECWLRDLKSSTGTFVNGTRITAAEISDGDVIRSGETYITISLISDPSKVTAPSFGPSEFRLPADLLVHCTSATLPNGVIRLSSNDVRIRTIAMECVPFGLGILTKKKEISRELNDAGKSIQIGEGLIWLPVSAEIVERCLADFWGSDDFAWFVGSATPKSLLQLAMQSGQSGRPLAIGSQFNEATSATIESTFGDFYAVLVKDDSSATGWSLFSRPRFDVRQIERNAGKTGITVNPKPKDKSRLSSVA